MNKILLIIATLFTGFYASAQTIADSNFSAPFAQVSHIKTFGHLSNVSFFNNRLYFNTSGLIFSAPYNGRTLTTVDLDTTKILLSDSYNYVVKHPTTGHLFLTKRNSNGKSLLYERTTNPKGKTVVQKVRLGKFTNTIVHPTFSADGKIIVFSSDNPIGFGGYDLWFSTFENGIWTQPKNLGRRINSEGNEFSPTIIGEFLYFSSDALQQSSNIDIFATRLISSQTIIGDTINQFPIGRSKVQRLPYPFNTEGNDFGFVCSDDNSSCYWISSSSSDSNDHIYFFNGSPNAVVYNGTVTSLAEDSPIPFAKISVALASQPEKVLFDQETDSTGKYKIWLQPEQNYRITFSCKDYLSNTEEFNTHRLSEETPLWEVDYSPILLTYNRYQQYPYLGENLFGSSVGSELTKSGKRTLQPIIAFLKENPHLKLKITAVYSLTDPSFDQILNSSRLQAILQYFAHNHLNAAEIEATTLEKSWAANPESAIISNAILFYFSEK